MSLLAILIGFLSIMVPGFFLAFALLRRTEMPMFEIIVIGFIFGLIFPPTMIWLESYLIPYIHAFTFSSNLYNINVLILTAFGIVLSVQQGALNLGDIRDFRFGVRNSGLQTHKEYEADYKKRVTDLRSRIRSLSLDLTLIKMHEKEEQELYRRHQSELEKLQDIGPEERAKIEEAHKREEKRLFEEHESEENTLIRDGSSKEKRSLNYVWIILFLLMLFTFATRMFSIGIAWKFFEFDPYFDMMSTEFILADGYQLLYSHSAWPTLANGTIQRIQPIVPYLEAYWYQLTNPNTSAINTTLLSNVSSYYPAIAAALLVFAVFMFLYHEYGDIPALVGATLAALMPAIIQTFIAGEQLLEPWGIFTLFFFYAAYLLAIKNMKEKRFAMLAGIAFASTFLGAHYYTVDAGVLGIYIALQGMLDVTRGRNLRDFYVMNAIVIAIIAIFYFFYSLYGSALAAQTPGILHIPIVVALPLFALIFVAVLDYAPKLGKQYGVIKSVDGNARLVFLGALIVIVLILAILTPLGEPLKKYIQLSTHFTTPSIPLFMTVQEYAPTGFNYNFGPGGFGIIGASIGGVDIIVWGVMIVFTLLMLFAIYKRDSKISILSVSAILPLMVAGMLEVKYLPHFGVGYIIAIGTIIGEALIILNARYKGSINYFYALYGVVAFIVIMEFINVSGMFLGIGQTCTQISNSGNGIAYDLYCNVVPNYWLTATAWMRANIGPNAARVLSWWDYGDWINWFGNTNAVIRGDNTVATLDYATAAHYVFTPNFSAPEWYPPSHGQSTTFPSFMSSVQAKYVLFDDQLMQKWQALDFLACIDVNATSRSYATSQGALYGQPYILGTSQCELTHDPAYIIVPQNPSGSVNNFCTYGNSTAIKGYLVVGPNFANQTYCVPSAFTNGQNVRLYTQNGSITNILLVPSQQFYYGTVSVSSQPYYDFLVLYLPNGPNDTITNAPTEFYNSTFYKGFFFGRLPGFKLVYPGNFTGVNYVNSTNQIMIFELDNFTGALPPLTTKPSWVKNNYTIPG